MKSQSDFNTLPEYRVYLLAYFTGQIVQGIRSGNYRKLSYKTSQVGDVVIWNSDEVVSLAISDAAAIIKKL